MGSLLGFRCAHFSEEDAWLPGWLQQQDEEPLCEAIGDTQSCFEKRIEEFRFLQENSNATANATLLSSKEGGYKSFQLFLSGDNSSPLSAAPSTGNVVDVHLHLSTDGSSQNMLSFTEETSERDNPILNQTIKASVPPDRECNKFNAKQSAGLSIAAPTLRCQRPYSESAHEEIDGCSEATDISSAIELSIAASEAMVIHEVIGTMSLSKSLSSSAVLEGALQLKQARLDVWEDTTQCSTEQSGEGGCLSDLDDISMKDAYDDVGLSDTDVGVFDSPSFDIPQPKGTTSSDVDRHNEKYEVNVVPESDCSKAEEHFVNQRLEDVLESNIDMKKDSAIRYSAGKRENTYPQDPILSSDTNTLASCDDLVVHYQLQKNLDVSASKEKIISSVREKYLSKVATSSPLNNISEDAGKGCEVLSTVPERFQSRWFGGWTWKEVKSSAPAEHNHKSIPKPFVHETSFFSESADVAPDENSVVQKQDRETILASQSSIPSQSLHTKANVEILFSQSDMKSPSLSLIDPLCSIVPCSISSENGCVTSALNHDDRVLTEGCLKPVTENAKDNVQRASESNNMLLDSEELAVPDSMEELHPAVRRKLTSLRTYSMLLPEQGTFIAKEDYCDKSLPEGSNEMSNLLMMQSTVAHLRDEQRKYVGTVKDGAELPVGMQKNKTLPLILNRGTRHRLQASNVLTHEFGSDEVLKQMAARGKDKEHPSSKSTHKIQSKCDPKSVTPVPARKRVSFSETEAKISLKDKLQEQPASRTCESRRAAKKVRQCNPPYESRALELRSQPKHCHEQHRKRLLLQNMEFLLTGFSCQKEKGIENLIRMHGGLILSDIPHPPTSRVKRNSRLKSKALPIVLCMKKTQTIKFLYGCAVHAHMLKVTWLTDSIAAGSLLPPQRYTILQKHVGIRHFGIRKPANYDGYPSIFDGVGVMLLGKSSFCTGMAKVVKHGDGQVFKTLQWLVQSLETRKISTGVIIAEEESRTSRHLTQCALEQNIPVLPACWIIKCLYRGKLLPYKKKKNPALSPPIKPADCPDSVELSMEI